MSLSEIKFTNIIYQTLSRDQDFHLTNTLIVIGSQTKSPPYLPSVRKRFI